MPLRNFLLSLAATPDRAWLLLLAGLLLLSREFVRPGRVVPGVLGGVAVVVSVHSLASSKLSVPGLTLVGVAALLLVVQFRFSSNWWPGLASALLAAAGARLLVLPPWSISIPAAMAAVPAVFLLSFLLRGAAKARANKVGDWSRSSR